MTSPQAPHIPTSAPTPSNAFWQRFRDLGALRRPSDHRALGGVAEGLSRHFDIDPIIVRVLFVALTFFGGAGIILYVALWLTVPQAHLPHSFISGKMHRDPSAVVTAGLAVGGIGAAVAFLGSLSWAVPHPFPFLLVVALIALVAVAFTRRRDGQWTYPPPPAPGTYPAASAQPGTPTSPPAAPGAGTPGPDYPASGGTATNLPATYTAPGYPTTMTEETSDLATTADPAAQTYPTGQTYPTAQAQTATQPSTQATLPQPTPAWWQRDQEPPTGSTGSTFSPMPMPMIPQPPARPKSHLFAITMAAIALALAGLWIADVATSLDPDPSVYPGVALGLIAVGLLVSTWWGRSRGLIVLGLVAGLVTGGAAVLGPGPYGDVVHDPTAASQLRPSYRLGAGQLTLRLEDVADIENLNGMTTSLEARFGRVLVIVPSSIAATIDATVEHGEIHGAPSVQDIDNDGEHSVLAPSNDGRPTMTIKIHLRFGQIQIERATCPGDGFPLPGESTATWKGDTRVAAACI